MKQLVMALAFLVSTTAAFANETSINSNALNSFKKEFAAAQDAKWADRGEFYEVNFTLNGKYITVFYSTEGQRMGVARNLPSTELPVLLQNDIASNYKSYWISGLFELTNAEGTSYYVTLENADSKLMLKSNDAHSWNKYSKSAK